MKINTDASQAIAAKFDIRGIPTFAILKGAREVARISGAMGFTRFVEWVRANI